MYIRSAEMTQLTVKPMEYSVILISARLNANKMMRFFIIHACDIRLSSLCPKNNQIREPFLNSIRIFFGVVWVNLLLLIMS